MIESNLAFLQVKIENSIEFCQSSFGVWPERFDAINMADLWQTHSPHDVLKSVFHSLHRPVRCNP